MSWWSNIQSKYPCQNDKIGEYSMKPFDHIEDKEATFMCCGYWIGRTCSTLVPKQVVNYHV